MPTETESQAWLAGYEAAVQAAESCAIRIGEEELDEAIQMGIELVASTLRATLARLEEIQ